MMDLPEEPVVLPKTTYELLTCGFAGMEQGLCHPDNRPDYVPREAFFSSRSRMTLVQGVRMRGWKLVDGALSLCEQCPVQYQCFRYAVENGMAGGIWGAEEEDVKRWQTAPWDTLESMITHAQEDGTPIQLAATKETP